MTDTDHILEKHDKRLNAVEAKLSSHDSILDSMSRDIIAIRAEASARAETQSQGMDRLSNDIKALTVQLAESTGAQKESARIAEETQRQKKAADDRRLAILKRFGIIIGILCTLGSAIGSTLLSDQEVASTIWVKWFHIQEPWDNTQTGKTK